MSVSGRHDPGLRRRSKRSGREAGCWAYIPADALAQAGFAPGDPPPFYRTWGHRRGPHSGSVIVSLYRTP